MLPSSLGCSDREKQERFSWMITSSRVDHRLASSSSSPLASSCSAAGGEEEEAATVAGGPGLPALWRLALSSFSMLSDT